MSRLPDEATFLRDVASHQMEILNDAGVYRHLRFKKPGSFNMFFNVTTWPGYLCFSGDMGCYVFCRLRDMFEFFRRDGQGDGEIFINPDYWGQKVESVDRHGGLKVYEPHLFKEAVGCWLDEAEADHELRMAVADRVLSMADEGEHEAIQAAMNFEHEGYAMVDFWETNVREYSYRFIWCCYAIAWAIQLYDLAIFARRRVQEREVP